jgi:hypothetical protein
VLYYIASHVNISTFISDDGFYIYVYRFMEGTIKLNEIKGYICTCTLLGEHLLCCTEFNDGLYHVPFHSTARVEESGKQKHTVLCPWTQVNTSNSPLYAYSRALVIVFISPSMLQAQFSASPISLSAPLKLSTRFTHCCVCLAKLVALWWSCLASASSLFWFR